jgi:hypothetical protein
MAVAAMIGKTGERQINKPIMTWTLEMVNFRCPRSIVEFQSQLLEQKVE